MPLAFSRYYILKFILRLLKVKSEASSARPGEKLGLRRALAGGK
jgi:hypothetical protein